MIQGNFYNWSQYLIVALFYFIFFLLNGENLESYRGRNVLKEVNFHSGQGLPIDNFVFELGFEENPFIHVWI